MGEINVPYSALLHIGDENNQFLHVDSDQLRTIIATYGMEPQSIVLDFNKEKTGDLDPVGYFHYLSLWIFVFPSVIAAGLKYTLGTHIQAIDPNHDNKFLPTIPIPSIAKESNEAYEQYQRRYNHVTSVPTIVNNERLQRYLALAASGFQEVQLNERHRREFGTPDNIKRHIKMHLTRLASFSLSRNTAYTLAHETGHGQKSNREMVQSGKLPTEEAVTLSEQQADGVGLSLYRAIQEAISVDQDRVAMLLFDN